MVNSAACSKTPSQEIPRVISLRLGSGDCDDIELYLQQHLYRDIGEERSDKRLEFLVVMTAEACGNRLSSYRALELHMSPHIRPSSIVRNIDHPRDAVQRGLFSKELSSRRVRKCRVWVLAGPSHARSCP